EGIRIVAKQGFCATHPCKRSPAQGLAPGMPKTSQQGCRYAADYSLPSFQDSEEPRGRSDRRLLGIGSRRALALRFEVTFGFRSDAASRRAKDQMRRRNGL